MRLISVYITLLFATVAALGRHSCKDDAGRFVVRQNGEKDIFRSCGWARNADTAERCLIDNVYANCPGLCDPSCPCVDDTGKFGIKDLKANLLCKDGKKKKSKKRFCNIKKFAKQCPETCNTKNINKKDKKTKTIRTKVPSFQVTCDEDVQSWYRELSYCDNAKFRYKCPQKCKICPQQPTTGTNLAVGKSATQSSMREWWFGTPRPASNAVDGSTSGEDAFISMTEVGKPGIWNVDLEGSFKIEKIVIWNRSNPDYVHQLYDFTVEVIDNGTIVWSEFYADVPNLTATFTLPAGTKGDEVKVLRYDFLQLAEVQVFGY